MSTILMKCGCTALGTDSEGKPVCPVHIGIHPGAEQVDDTPPSLKGRMAFCCYCNTSRPSDYSLPFFTVGRCKKGVQSTEQDEFYCGCRGWE